MLTSLHKRFLLAMWGILFGTAIGQTQLCPTEVSNGTVTSSCSRQPGSVCSFTCNSGFTPAAGINSVTCGSDGKWTFTSAVCVEAKCSTSIPNGFLPMDCKLEFGTTCPYYCNDRFDKNPNISSVTCNENRQWNADIRLLCAKTKATCPQNVPGGSWVNCRYRENETCTYNCFVGFHQNARIQNATCGSDGIWNQNTEKLCTRKCEMGIPNGHLNSTCTLTIGEVCSFKCTLGFKATSGVKTVTCQESGEWATAEPCKEVFCPTTIPNGTVSALECDRRVYSACPFTCNQGFDPNPKFSRLNCGIYGNWVETATPSCLARQGLCINFFEHGRWARGCQFREKETCAFECEGGFDKNPNITGNITCTSSAKWNMDLSLLCKRHDRGLIVTLIPGDTDGTTHVQTVPTSPEGAPNLVSIQSLRSLTDLLFYSVDGDYALRQAYAYDYNTGSIYRNSNFSIGLSGNNKWTSVHTGLSKGYVKLAVDWINHNIYWTDPQYKWIVVQSLLGNETSMYRVLIDDNLEEPHALALDPMEALLFWSDIGRFTKIEVSSLSGRNRKSLISSNLLRPYSLAADYVARRLYWLDSGRDTLETVTYEGKERQILLRKSDSNFFDIAVYKDYLYVTDMYDQICFFNKTNGKELHESLSSAGQTFLGVTVFHPEAQTTSATAHCVNYGCEHICVTEKDGATCVCRDGYSLNQDMKTCLVNNEYFHRGLIFSNKSSICIVDVRVVTHFSYDPKCVLESNGTKYMVLDTDQRQILIANDTSIYWARVDNLKLSRLTEQSGMISGLAWDGYDRNVYWSEKDTGSIWRLSRESYTAKVFLEGLNKPRDILILPQERLLYWISDRNGSTIESSSLDGSNHRVVLDNRNLVKPKSLTYDLYTKRIYFLDISTKGLNYVFSCKLDGSDLNNLLSTDKILEKLEIYKGHLLLTSNNANGTLIMSYSMDLIIDTTSGVFHGAGNLSTIKVFDENFRQNETVPCFNFNGECEQICVSNGKSRICECTFGFKLGPNGKNCVSDPIKDNFMMIVDSTHNDIYQINLTDQSIQGINAKGTNSLTSVTYSPVHDLVIWGTHESEVSIIHLNGTGKKIFPISMSDDNIHFPNRFAVDFSTGNIYYTAVSYMEYFEKYKSYLGVLSPNGKHRVLVTGLSYPHGLVVHPLKGLLFYTDSGYKTYLGQANMDGTQATVLLDIDNDNWPTELTIDYKLGYLYWVEHLDDSISYCKLDGTNHNKLVQYPASDLRGLAFYQDYLYIAGGEHVSMRKLKISNPNETTGFAAYGELGRIESIIIYSSTVQIKNAFCSEGNGGCSTFCFPTPRGGQCGCEDGEHLKEGSDKFCSNIPQCPEILNKIIVSTDCQRVNGSKCTFTCKQGYKARQGVNNVLCNGVTYTPKDSCEEILCPSEIPNGVLLKGSDGHECTRAVGTRCEFECNSGFVKGPSERSLHCQIEGWAEDPLCAASSAESSARESDANPAAIGSGVAIGITIVIVIIVVTVFVIFRRRNRNSDLALKRMEEEVTSEPDTVMNTILGPMPDRENTQVTYENGAVHITGPNKREEPDNLSLPPINTGRDDSKRYDNSVSIPRPRAKGNLHTNKF